MSTKQGNGSSQTTDLEPDRRADDDQEQCSKEGSDDGLSSNHPFHLTTAVPTAPNRPDLMVRSTIEPMKEGVEPMPGPTRVVPSTTDHGFSCNRNEIMDHLP